MRTARQEQQCNRQRPVRNNLTSPSSYAGNANEADCKPVWTQIFVQGLCCPAEAPLIERMLLPLDGVHTVNAEALPSRLSVVLMDAAAACLHSLCTYESLHPSRRCCGLAPAG